MPLLCETPRISSKFCNQYIKKAKILWMINWKKKRRLIIPHTGTPFCANTEDTKEKKNPRSSLSVLRSQWMNRSTEGCCLCLLCNTGCLLWKCKREDERRMEEGEREGRMQVKKKKGNSVYYSSSPRPAGKLNTVRWNQAQQEFRTN